MNRLINQLSPAQIISFSYALVILVGGLLLMLPGAADQESTGFLDALFTAASAACVTGLVVHDTATHWSLFGQFIILLLIQIGGLGVITVAMGFARLARKTISLKQRSILQEAITAPKVGGIVKLTGFIVKTFLLLELAGFLLLAPVFCSDLGFWKGLWYALFHAVSAFCNAGFDLMGQQMPYASLTAFATQPYVLAVIMTLIILGGIGFLTWDDIRLYRLQFARYTMQSKAILITTVLLITLPCCYFFCFELSHLPLSERIGNALFQSVTARTAGFNSVDLTQFSEIGLLIFIILMLIGGAPGSTAGGMKTTTASVVCATLFSVLRQKRDTQMFHRRVAENAVRTAFSLALLYVVLSILAGCIISHIENLALLSCIFESASALATVGLSLGLTPELGNISKCILILLMYIGRVGSLTLIFSAMSNKNNYDATLPQETITIG